MALMASYLAQLDPAPANNETTNEQMRDKGKNESEAPRVHAVPDAKATRSDALLFRLRSYDLDLFTPVSIAHL